MTSPFPGSPPVIKIEDERESDPELRDMFTEDIMRRLELIRRRRGLQSSAQSLPSPSQPVQQLLPPPPPPPLPPPPPPPAQHPCAKRPATGPPPGFAEVRKPPLKQYQRRQPAGVRAPTQQQQPPPPALDLQRVGHAPQPAPDAHGGATAATLAVHASPSVVPVLGLQRRTGPKPPHPAAKKKPTVLCTVCGVLCMTMWHLKQHEKGRKHRNRVAYLAGEMNVRCLVCNVHLSSGLNVEQHNAGKQHLQRLYKGA